MNKHALLPILVTTMLALFLLLGTAPLSAQTFNDYSPRGHLIGSASQALFAKPTAEILSAPMHSGSGFSKKSLGKLRYGSGPY